MAKKDQSEQEQRCARLKQVFADLAARGITQRQAAIELNVPPQYLSDVKNGHRSLTEPFARRIAEVYGVSFVWLVSGQGPRNTSRLDVPGTSQTDTVMLPVLAEPIAGDPALSVAWDGSKLEVSGAAAAMAARASQPYILRITNDDVDGRLGKNDLVLVSQQSTESTTIALLQHRGRIVLARREARGGWKVMDTGRAVSANARIVGGCLGIVWAPL